MNLFLKSFLVLLFLCQSINAALHADAAAGFSFASEYSYWDHTDTIIANWIDFIPANAFSATGRLSIDIYKESFSLGIMSGYMRRYDLYSVARTSGTAAETKSKIGNVSSIPILAFIENRYKGFFYEFGLGPYITRFNYTRSDLPQMQSTAFFGYLFGGGYTCAITKTLGIQVKGELFLNSPVFPVEYLDNTLTDEIKASRNTPYNRHDFQTIIYCAAISAGITYTFCPNISAPIDKFPQLISSLWARIPFPKATRAEH